MATEIYLSDAQYHANSMLLERLKKRRGKSSRQIVIVPDRFTLNSERNVLEYLGIKGAFDISVTSFRRLASYVLGKRASSCMSAEASVMLLSRVIIEKREELKYYKNAHKKGGFASEIYAVLTLLRNSGVTVEALKGAIGSMPDAMQKKCEDIALLYEEYLHALSQGVMDGSSLLEALVKQIPESDYIATSDIYVTDYFSFTEAQRRVLKALMERARSVSIAMVKGTGKNARIYPDKELARIKAISRSVGIEAQEIYERAPLSSARKKVADELFAYAKNEKTEGGAGIRIYEAEDKEEEILHLARRIRLLVKEGYRYKDVAVLTSDVESAIPLFKKIFSAHKIPFFANEKKALSTTPIALFVVQAIKSAIEGMERDGAITLVKNPYSGIEKEAGEAFQIYTEKYNVNYSRLTGEYTLGARDKEYQKAKAVGGKLSSLLCPLPSIDTVENFTLIIKEFIASSLLEEKSETLARIQREKGDLLASSTTSQSYRKLIDVAEELINFAGKALISDEEYLSLLSNALSSVKISYVPVFSDSVYVGGARESRFDDCKVFFIAGAVEGKLPSLTKREGIFGDREAELLKKLDIDLSPTSTEAGLEEKLHILQLLLMPKEKLFISYTSVAGAKSELAEGLKNLFCDIRTESANTLIHESFEEYISLLCSSREGARLALSTCEDGKVKAYLEALVGKFTKREKERVGRIENGKELFFPDNKTTVTKIESYFRCPYRHFIEKGLGITKMETAESKSFAGTFIHRIFELALPALKKENFPIENVERVNEIARTVIEKVLGEERFAVLSTEKYVTTKRRLSEESLRIIRSVCSHCASSKYIPVGFEVEFGGGDNAFYLDGKYVKPTLRGKIDRIDEYNGKKILVDYKTGRAPAEVKDVYYGTGVQLYVYMAALEKLKDNKCAGALYYPLVGDFENHKKTDGGRLRGFMLGEEMDKFDGRFSYQEGSSYIAYSLKGGKPTADSSVLSCTEEELDKIKKYSLDVCTRAVDEIALGNIDSTPIENACDYCDFGVICKGKEVRERKIDNVKKSIITGEKGDTGNGN